MLNKHKIEGRATIPERRHIDAPNKKVCKPKGYPSPNKLLKYNYKHSVDRMQERSARLRSSFKKMVERQPTEETVEQIYENEFDQQIKSHHIRHSFIQSANLTNLQNIHPSDPEKKYSWRHRSVSLCKSVTENSHDDPLRSMIKFERKCSESTVRKEKCKVNPYTKSQYLYVKNQSKDEEIRRKIANQNRVNFGLNLQKSCKIISFELINPLEKYDKAEKAHKTNSTLPECFLEEQEHEERPFQLKLHSKQIPISYRKKSAYYKHIRSVQTAFPNKTKNPHIQAVFNDFEPTPWESTPKHCDLFYLKAEEL